MDDNERKYWVAFTRIPRVGTVRVREMERHFGTLSKAWAADSEELGRAGLDRRTAQNVVTRRPDINPDAEIEKLEAQQVQALTWHDPEYPAPLKEIHDPPPVLYVRGRLLPEDQRSVAVVGTRRVTAYGRQVAQQFSHDIAQSKVTVVSGLAYGVDAVAHRAALEAGGRTIAVMASGADVIYPREHENLAERITENGALVSEHPVSTRPRAENFPRRNRIMSGIALGTVVVEASDRSGALITARHALEQNREVFAVPGNVFSPNSRGTNNLIMRSGAKLVSDFKDVLEELNLSWVGQQIEMEALFPANEDESKIIGYLSNEPIHIDEITRSSGMDISTVSSVLAMMELRGMVRQTGGMSYIREGRPTPREEVPV